MIATEPKKHEPCFTTLEPCCDEDNDACTVTNVVPLRPILFFSYEGQVAVEGIVAILPAKKLNENGNEARCCLSIYMFIYVQLSFLVTAIDPPEHQKKQLAFHG